MRVAAHIVALLAAVTGFFLGFPAVLIRGTALFDLIPAFILPVLSVAGLVLVYFRPRTAAILLALSALTTIGWPFAVADHLSQSGQIAQKDVTFRSAMFAVPSFLAALAASLAWFSRDKK
jgi:hypothetical protein